MAAVPFSRPGVSLGLGHGSGGPLACTGGLASCWPLTQVVRAGLVSLVLSAFLRLETYLQHQVMRKVTCCLKLMETGDSVTETGWRKVGHCCHSPGSGDPMGAGCSWFWRPHEEGHFWFLRPHEEGRFWFWRLHGGGAFLVLETPWGRGVPGSVDPKGEGRPWFWRPHEEGRPWFWRPFGEGHHWFWRPHGGGTLRVLETLQGGVLPGALRPLTLRLCTRSEL